MEVSTLMDLRGKSTSYRELERFVYFPCTNDIILCLNLQHSLWGL